ncbi:hypothetical protein VTK73DRAFT_3002 [Phialemonium thermophilum]|uniref:Isochorismatase-like domain-containing protein n=1 Tax=Phialemonium thermophilum TaxID=223376 RepID=A0ABR3Y255_9PEZI
MAGYSRRLQNNAIFVCDIQDKFRKAIYGFDDVVRTTTKVLRAAKLLSIPVYVTTQNRARLGDTVSELRPHLDAAELKEDVDKTRFSMWVPDVARHFPSPSGSQDQPANVVIVGIEAHICVTQTALDLLAAGHGVRVLADGVSSSSREEAAVALARLRAEGAVVTTSESWLYELIGDAAAPEFRDIVSLVKDTAPDSRRALQTLLASKI